MAYGFPPRRARTLASAGALAALLALGACNSPSEPAAENSEAALNDAVLDENAVDEDVVDEATIEDVEVEAVPAVTSSTSSPDATAVAAAAASAAAIAADTGITRVRHGDGWAWMRNGQIVRTASRDGKQVAYFRNGEDAPYFVQRDDRGYTYEGGKVRGVVDRNGRSEKPDATRTREAEQVARTARNQRDEARQQASRSPRPTATGSGRTQAPAPTQHGSRDTDTARPTPTPTRTAAAPEAPRRTEPTANQRGDRAVSTNPRAQATPHATSDREQERREDGRR